MRTWIAGLVLIGTLITVPCKSADVETSVSVQKTRQKARPAVKPNSARQKQLDERKKFLEEPSAINWNTEH